MFLLLRLGWAGGWQVTHPPEQLIVENPHLQGSGFGSRVGFWETKVGGYVSVCLSPAQVLVVKAQVAGRERGVGGAGEVLQNQEVSHRLPGEAKRGLWVPFSSGVGMFLADKTELLLLSLIQPFVEVCVKSNNKYEAKKYVPRVAPDQKVRAHLAIR